MFFQGNIDGSHLRFVCIQKPLRENSTLVGLRYFVVGSIKSYYYFLNSSLIRYQALGRLHFDVDYLLIYFTKRMSIFDLHCAISAFHKLPTLFSLRLHSMTEQCAAKGIILHNFSLGFCYHIIWLSRAAFPDLTRYATGLAFWFIL